MAKINELPSMRSPECTFDQFAALDLRVAKVLEVESFPAARKPAYILHLDCGAEWGVLKTSAQITERYAPEDLIGKLIVAIVNFPDKQIGPVQSQCLVLGGLDENNGVTLLIPDHDCSAGTRIA